MTLGASALGQFALAGTGYEAAGGINYVNCAAAITITSAVACSLSIVGQVHIAADIAITSSVQCALTVIPAAVNYVNISASITMVSALISALSAVQTFPDPGVGFTISDNAGGA